MSYKSNINETTLIVTLNENITVNKATGQVYIDGNLGINEIDPQYKLHVNGSGYFLGDTSVPNSPTDLGFYLGKSLSDENRRLGIVSPSGGIGYIDFTKPSVDFRGRIAYYDTGDSFRFYTSASERLRMDATTSQFFGSVTATSFIGNASTATNLLNSRTLTIGNTGKLFNGSTNVSWSLPEIGAQPVGNYVTLDTAQTITAVKTFTNSLTVQGLITFNSSSTNNGFVWNVNSDSAGIRFKNTADNDTNSFFNFYTKDNGVEYFKFSHTTWNIGSFDYMDIRNGIVRVNGNIYINSTQSGDHTLETNNLTGGELVASQPWVLSQGFLTTETDSQTLTWSPVTSTLSISNGNSVIVNTFETDLTVGKTGFAGTINFKRPSDGNATGQIGYYSSTDVADFGIANGSGGGDIRFKSNGGLLRFQTHAGVDILTVNQSGNLVTTGTLSASNLSGTNTGDQNYLTSYTASLNEGFQHNRGTFTLGSGVAKEWHSPIGVYTGTDFGNILRVNYSATYYTDLFFNANSGSIYHRKVINGVSEVWKYLLDSSNFIAGTHYQTPITNPVTGTGTSGYLPKFTGTSTLGNSSIYDNGTSVGIGTTTPAQLLHLLGSNSLTRYQNNTTNWDLGLDAGDSNFKFKHASIELARFTNTGNFGFGIIPSARVEIKSSTSDTTANALVIRNSSNTALFSVRNDGRTDVNGSFFVNHNDFSFLGTSPILTANSSNGASGLRVNVTGVVGDVNSLFRIQDEGTTRLTIQKGGNSVFTGTVTASSFIGDGGLLSNVVNKKSLGVTINTSTFVNVARVEASSLGTNIKMIVRGTSASAVLNVVADIFVGHPGNIIVKSYSGQYSQLAIKIDSNTSEDFNISLKRIPGVVNDTPVSIEFITSHTATCTTYSNNPVLDYTNNSHTHETKAGTNLTGIGQSIPASYVQNNLMYHAGNFIPGTDYLSPTALAGYATEVYVNSAISNIIDSAPGTLDTLNELAAALGDDPNFATTMTTLIGTKYTKNEDILIQKTSPTLRLFDNNVLTGSYPAIIFDTQANQGIQIVYNEFDGELPTSGYGLIVTGSPTNNQFPATSILSFTVHGKIYAGGTTNGTVNEVYHAGNFIAGTNYLAPNGNGSALTSVNAVTVSGKSNTLLNFITFSRTDNSQSSNIGYDGWGGFAITANKITNNGKGNWRNSGEISILENLGTGAHYIYGGSPSNSQHLALGASNTTGVSVLKTTGQAGALDVNGNGIFSGTLFASGRVSSNSAPQFQKPTDYWEDSSFYGLNNLGGLHSRGAFEVTLSSNGYRNNLGTWTSYEVSTLTGASQISLNPNGTISFNSESNKPTGSASSVTTRMTLLPSGRLGINTINPTHSLDIMGAHGEQFSVGGLGQSGRINFKRGSDEASAVDLGFNGATETQNFVFRHGGGGGFFSWITNSGSLTEKMRLTNTGNLGIGVISPTYKLEVLGSSTLGFKLQTDGFSGLDLFSPRTSGNVGGLRFMSTENIAFSSEFNGTVEGTFEWKTGNGSVAPTTKMWLTQLGYLGVGITPTERLHISGNGIISGNLTVARIFSSGGSSTVTPNLLLGPNSDSDNIYTIMFGTDTSQQFGMGRYSSARGYFSKAGLGIHIDGTKEFTIKSSSWTNLFGVEGGTGNGKFKGTVEATSFIGSGASLTNIIKSTDFVRGNYLPNSITYSKPAETGISWIKFAHAGGSGSITPESFVISITGDNTASHDLITLSTSSFSMGASITITNGVRYNGSKLLEVIVNQTVGNVVELWMKVDLTYADSSSITVRHKDLTPVTITEVLTEPTWDTIKTSTKTSVNQKNTRNVIYNKGVEASAFYVTGGTSSGFLKGDGSLDISTYLTTTGIGTSLTDLNASNISIGTLNDARLSTNVALKTINNNFTTTQTIKGVVDGIFNGLIIENRKSYGTGTGINETSRLLFSITESGQTDPLQRIFAFIESGPEVEISSADSYISIGNRTSGVISEKVRITSSGNVGIGISPSQKLHVSGNGLITGTLEVDTVNNGVGDFLTRTAGGIITRRTASEVILDLSAVTTNTAQTISGIKTFSNTIVGNISGNADTVDGAHLVETTGHNGVTWGRIPYLKSDGVLEIGRYLDFHHTSNSGVDNAVRVHTNGTSNQELFINNSRIFTDSYHPDALKWTTARTVTFAGGDVTGSFTIDGSADVSNVNLQVTNNSHTHNTIVSLDNQSAETERNVLATGIYTYNVANGVLGAGASVTNSYYSVLAFGRGVGGSAQFATGWVSGGTQLYFRSLRDFQDNWYDWKTIYHSGNLTTSILTPLLDATYVNVTGDTMTGSLVLNNNIRLQGKSTTDVVGNLVFIDSNNVNVLGNQLNSTRIESSGTTTIINNLHAGGEIVVSGAKLQVNGFMRTGPIYIHEDSNNVPLTSNLALTNVTGSLKWAGETLAGQVWVSTNFVSKTGTVAESITGLKTFSNGIVVNSGITIDSADKALYVKNTAILGSTLNDTKLLSEFHSQGNINNMYNRQWLVRTATGSDWTTVEHIDGISVDVSYVTPGTSRTWWKRNPNTQVQSFGSAASTYLSMSTTATSIEGSLLVNSNNVRSNNYNALDGGHIISRWGGAGVKIGLNDGLAIGAGEWYSVLTSNQNSAVEVVSIGAEEGLVIYSNTGSNVSNWATRHSIIMNANVFTYGGNNIWHAGNSNINSVDWTVKDLIINKGRISNQENLDVDTGTEVIATASKLLYDAVFFDFVIKNGLNLRAGTVTSTHDGTNVEYNEMSTQDLGDTSGVTLSVDISGNDIRLLATSNSDNWVIKSLIRGI